MLPGVYIAHKKMVRFTIVLTSHIRTNTSLWAAFPARQTPIQLTKKPGKFWKILTSI